MNKVSQSIIDLLNSKYEQYNRSDFIESDPISIPHLFSRKEDIEIIGFIMATISWGQRKTIIKNGRLLLDILGESPLEYILSFDLNAAQNSKQFTSFKHRTFNAVDLASFCLSLKDIYTRNQTLEQAFLHKDWKTQQDRISGFSRHFFSSKLPLAHARSCKHVSDPGRGSAAKRINMFLRWMVRKDQHGVDFGIWNELKMSDLCLPLDVHTGNVSRKLGLLKRKQNDWKTVEEISDVLRSIDPNDPIKYDYSLFGLGVFDNY